MPKVICGECSKEFNMLKKVPCRDGLYRCEICTLRRTYKRLDRLPRLYGITVEDYAQKLLEQKGMCKLCGKLALETLRVDHNHNTGKIRGLLCHKCNVGLGHFDDSLVTLKKAVEYLESNDG